MNSASSSGTNSVTTVMSLPNEEIDRSPHVMLSSPLTITTPPHPSTVGAQNVHNNEKLASTPDSAQLSPIDTEVIFQSSATLSSKRKQARRALRRAQGEKCTQQHPSLPDESWNNLPAELIVRIFASLSMRDRHSASQCCWRWFHCFYQPEVWSHFILDDIALTKRKFNYYLGYQRMLDPFKTQAYLKRFGRCLRTLYIDPMSNFYNLFEFMKILENYGNHVAYESPLEHLRLFDFTFGCQFTSSDFTGDGAQNSRRRLSLWNIHDGLIGTGGRVLEALIDLLYKLGGLESLALRNLLLAPHEAQFLLDGVAERCHLGLRQLTLINGTQRLYEFLHPGVFVNLNTIALSPQHLGPNILALLGELENLKDVYVVQTEFTSGTYPPQTRAVWRSLRKAEAEKRRNRPERPRIRIHLVLVNNLTSKLRNSDLPPDQQQQQFGTKNLLLQPVDICSVIYDSPFVSIRDCRLLTVIGEYAESLESVEFYQLPKFGQAKRYIDRPDQDLIWLSQNCPRLRRLIIREVISTATLLQIVGAAPSLKELIIRRNGLKKRYDSCRNVNWRKWAELPKIATSQVITSDAEFYDWLKHTSRSYEATFGYIRQRLGATWVPYSDEHFKRVRPCHQF